MWNKAVGYKSMKNWKAGYLIGVFLFGYACLFAGPGDVGVKLTKESVIQAFKDFWPKRTGTYEEFDDSYLDAAGRFKIVEFEEDYDAPEGEIIFGCFLVDLKRQQFIHNFEWGSARKRWGIQIFGDIVREENEFRVIKKGNKTLYRTYF